MFKEFGVGARFFEEFRGSESWIPAVGREFRNSSIFYIVDFNKNDCQIILRKFGEFCIAPLGQKPKLLPGTKPIHAGKNSWGINFCVNACGACIRARANTGKYFWGIISEICIRTFSNMYSHPCPLCLYGYSGCIHASLIPIHENILGKLISVRIHAAHVFAPGRIQENIPGELFMYWFRARG